MYRKVAWILGCLISLSTMAQADVQACGDSVSKQVDFTDAAELDTLTVSVSGQPCSQAVFTLVVARASGEVVYSYSGAFVDHMPYLIYEPELNKLVSFFVQRVAGDAIGRKTSDLPSYTDYESFYADTNDFVVVDASEYEHLRHVPRPILWHATGDSSWVHVVYKPEAKSTEVVMRGGVFH